MNLFRRNQDGAVALELCLVAPFLLSLLIGLFDFGFLMFQQMQVEAAAGAGALYARKLGAAGFDATKIAAAVAGAAFPTQSAIAASPAPYKACGCPNPAGTGMVVAACGSNCAGGSAAATYAVIAAQVTPTSIVAWPGFPATLNSGLIIRVE
jgi:Flp pilus assembly protein TadG